LTVGDIVAEIPQPKVIEITAGENLTKGNVVTLADANVADTGGDEYGPFGVAIEDIASGAKGKVIVKGIVEVKAGADPGGDISAFDMLVASTTTAGSVGTGVKGTDTFEEYVGIALEAIAEGGTGKMLLT